VKSEEYEPCGRAENTADRIRSAQATPKRDRKKIGRKCRCRFSVKVKNYSFRRTREGAEARGEGGAKNAAAEENVITPKTKIVGIEADEGMTKKRTLSILEEGKGIKRNP